MTTIDTETELGLEVTDKTETCEGVVVLRLGSPDGCALPRWSPGAHIDVQLQPGMIRQYSLCGDPDNESTWQIAVLREPTGRGGSQYVHDKLHVGDSVGVRGPRNNFQLEDSANYLFIAGGIGITPIMSMAAHVDRAGRSWRLVYGGRSRRSMAFAEQLCQHYPDNVTLHPQDQHGWIDLDRLLSAEAPETMIYCCGPAALLDAVTERCAHWAADALRIERFTPKQFDDPVPGDAFDVELAMTGKTITVKPNESVLDAVRACGVQVLSSCEEGTCGTCETPVLAGTVDHRDSVLTKAEQGANDTMMICVSRARCPRLVLEL